MKKYQMKLKNGKRKKLSIKEKISNEAKEWKKEKIKYQCIGCKYCIGHYKTYLEWCEIKKRYAHLLEKTMKKKCGYRKSERKEKRKFSNGDDFLLVSDSGDIILNSELGGVGCRSMFY